MWLLDELKTFWRTYVVILTPLLLLPLPLMIEGTEAACGYCVLIMAIYWLTEAIPLPATALLPMVLFPLLGVVPAKEVSVNYMKDLNFVFMGGLMMALSVENSNLHKRIALRVLMLMGSKPRWLMLGFMLPTWFLSMWISNTATTAMMIPVAEAVLVQLKDGMIEQLKKQRGIEGHENPALTPDGVELQEKKPVVQNGGYMPDETDRAQVEISQESGGLTIEEEATKKMTKINKMLCLAVAYSANVGGTATLTGTAPNLVLSGQAEKIWASHGLESPITWATWIPFGLPNAAICLVIGWVWLQTLYLGFKDCCCCAGEEHKTENDDTVIKVVKEEYRKLGKMKFAEIANLVFFIILIILWFARSPGFAPGYSTFFKSGYVSDSVPAMFVAVILFALPSERPKSVLLCKPKDEKTRRVPPLLDWPLVSTRLPWGPIFILGGGFALADACTKSGLSAVLADQMQVLSTLPQWVMVLLITTMIATLTEITSNTATTTLVLPILGALAEGINVNPLYLMLPATIAASMAFMLPVATPPNAIVFSYGHLRVVDMATAGFLMNILCIFVITLGAHTWGMALFNLNEVPWAINATLSTATPPMTTA